MMKRVEYKILPNDERYDLYVGKDEETGIIDGYVLIWGNDACMTIPREGRMYFIGKTDSDEIPAVGRKCWFPNGNEIDFDDLYDLLLQGIDIFDVIDSKSNLYDTAESVDKHIADIKRIFGTPVNQ